MADSTWDPKAPVDLAKLRSISVAGSAMPTRKVVVGQTEAREARWSKDIPAYRRLRKDGLQPRQVDGCAQLESKGAEAHVIEGRPDPKDVDRVSNMVGADMSQPQK